MDAFTEGDLRIDVDEVDDLVRLTWRGKSTARNPSQLLHPYFQGILAGLSPTGAPPRTLHLAFEHLEHFNSATISALIQLIHQCRALSAKLRITFDGRLKWQQLSFEALRALAKSDGMFEVRSVT